MGLLIWCIKTIYIICYEDMIDFSNRTREDFIAFDRRREEVMAPTQEEIKEQKRKEFEAKKDVVVSILSSY
jgi:hypothetical protein